MRPIVLGSLTHYSEGGGGGGTLLLPFSEEKAESEASVPSSDTQLIQGSAQAQPQCPLPQKPYTCP